MPWIERVELSTGPLYAGVEDHDGAAWDRPVVIPGKASLLLRWPGQTGTAKLFSADGRMVAKANLKDGKVEFSSLMPGTYLIRIKDRVLKTVVR